MLPSRLTTYCSPVRSWVDHELVHGGQHDAAVDGAALLVPKRSMGAAGPPTKPRSFADVAVFAAPGVFVVLWSSGFVGAKLGLAYAEPLTFLSLRMAGVLVALGVIIALTRPKWPNAAGVMHSAL